MRYCGVRLARLHKKASGAPQGVGRPVVWHKEDPESLQQLEMVTDATCYDVHVIVIGHIKSTSLDIGVGDVRVIVLPLREQ